MPYYRGTLTIDTDHAAVRPVVRETVTDAITEVGELVAFKYVGPTGAEATYDIEAADLWDLAETVEEIRVKLDSLGVGTVQALKPTLTEGVIGG